MGKGDGGLLNGDVDRLEVVPEENPWHALAVCHGAGVVRGRVLIGVERPMAGVDVRCRNDGQEVLVERECCRGSAEVRCRTVKPKPTIVRAFDGTIERLGNERKVLAKGKFINLVSEVHYFSRRISQEGEGEEGLKNKQSCEVCSQDIYPCPRVVMCIFPVTFLTSIEP